MLFTLFQCVGVVHLAFDKSLTVDTIVKLAMRLQ
jgi:hypothetical protein